MGDPSLAGMPASEHLALRLAAVCRKRKSRRLRELQNEIGWLDADLDAATAAPADGIFPGLLEQHDVPTPSISAWPPANGFHPIPPPHGHPLPRTHAHPHGASHHASPLQDGVLPTPQNPMDAPNGHALSQGLAPTGSSGALWNSQEHQPGGGNPFLRQGLQASPFAAAHAGSLGAEEGPRARSGSPRGVLPNVEALPQGLSLATELSLPEGLPLSAYPVPAGPVCRLPITCSSFSRTLPLARILSVFSLIRSC